MDEETSDTVGILMNIKNFREQKQRFKEGDGYNMCQAIKEMVEEGREEGRQEAEKEAVRIFIQISRDKGFTEEEILRDLHDYYGMSEQKALALLGIG